MPELRLGTRGPEVDRFHDYFTKWAASYAFLLGKRDAYYGSDEKRFTEELQKRLGVPITGRFGDLEASRTKYRWTGAATPPVVQRRKIWLVTSPGSGADFWVGPSWQLGRMVEGLEWNEPGRQSLAINHQPLAFVKGGYLGFLGGDPEFSYNEVIYSQYKALEAALDTNPDVQEAMRLLDQGVLVEKLELELWFSGYSQSADGMEDALEILFGDGGFKIPATGEIAGVGRYRALRKRINGLVQFGNPSTENTGIARKPRSAWMRPLVRNINADNDFYAKVPPSDTIRPPFYRIIVEAEMALPFFAHVLRIAVPVIMSYIPFLGLFGPLGQLAVAGMAGLNAGMPLLSSMFGQAASAGDDAVDAKLAALLSPLGILTNIPALIGLIAALPGLQRHGEYHLPMPEFNGRTGPQAAYDIIAGYRR